MKKYCSLVILLFLFISCSEDKDSENQRDLLGTWELLRFENESTNEVDLPPLSADEIMLTFETEDFEGITGRNSYFGTYTTSLNKLILLEFYSTEVAESEWGQKYLDAIVESYKSGNQTFVLEYEIESGQLVLNYTESKKMIFERK